MSADSPRRHHHNHHSTGGSGGSASSGVGSGSGSVGGVMGLRGGMTMPAIVPPQTVSDRSILDSAIGFINDVTLVHQAVQDPKDTITWARFETSADVSDPRFGDDWELEGNAAPPLLLILGYGLGVQVWAIPANGEAVEVLSWRHGVVTALRVLPTPATASSHLDNDSGRADEPADAFAEKRPLVALVDGGSAAASNLLSGGGGGSNPSGGIGIGNPSAASSHFSAVNFVSLKTGAQVKTIKFKNPVLDIQANRSAVVISFHERLAVFDARTLEDRLTITTCFPSPGINPNPIALGPRWLAYAEHKLLHSKRSGGGCDGEGVPSYTATVLNAAKSFGKGLRELGEQVAAGLTGASSSAGSNSSSKNSSFDSATGGADAKQSGVVTIIDVKHPIRDYSPTSGTPLSSTGGGAHGIGGDPIVAHFVAHSEALVAMEFDSSGMLLLTADRRGHDFHVFRIQPHPVGSSLAAVHHLYVLHRGDTSAKVQHIAFSLDSRWAAVSTLRGTTHVFPITPYGGAMGVRTHTSLHVVNKLSRFHRSAGLGADGRSSSPISHSESTTFVQSLQPYHNPTLPPFPRPAVVQPLAQLRQPFTLGSPPGSAAGSGAGSGSSGGGISSHHHHHHQQHHQHHHHHQHQHQRQRLSSLSDDSGKPLSVCATFAKSRSWLLEPPTATREAPHRVQRKAVDSLFVMAGHGALIQYDLDTKLASNVAKEKICDDTPIELEVEAKAQWNLGRRKDGSQEIVPPLALDNWLIKDRHASLLMDSAHHFDEQDERAESWLAQVEIITHAGPHRRLWMGPQFVFKNYNTPSGSNLNHVDAEAVEIGVTKTTTTTTPLPASSLSGGAPSSSSSSLSGASLLTPSGAIIAAVERSSPLNMPLSATGAGTGTGAGSGVPTTGRPGVPVLIESGSYSSIEQSPKLMDRFRHGHLDSDYGHGDMRLKEDLADAMRESPSTAAARQRETTTTTVQRFGSNTMDVVVVETGTATAAIVAPTAATTADNACYYDALTEHDDTDDQQQLQLQQLQDLMLPTTSTISALASVLPNIYSYEETTTTTIEKIVNPLGTVTDVNAGISGEFQTDILDEVVGQLSAEDCVIHENCDEALFRPVVAIFCDELAEQRKHELQLQQQQQQQLEDEATAAATTTATGGRQQQQQQQLDEHMKPPVVLANKLIVPVIAKEVDEVIIQKEKQAAAKNNQKKKQQQQQQQQQINNKTASSQLKPQTTTTASDEFETTTTTTLENELQSSVSSTISTKFNNSKKSKQKQQQQQQQQSNKKDKKQQQQQQQQQQQHEEQQTQDLDADFADSLLENKETIAAVMMSSASAQGLNLHVEPEKEKQKPETEKAKEKDKDDDQLQELSQKEQEEQAVKLKEKEQQKLEQVKAKSTEKAKQKELDEKLKQQEKEEIVREKCREFIAKQQRQLEEKEKEQEKENAKQKQAEEESEKEKHTKAKAKQQQEDEVKTKWDMEMPTEEADAERETETEQETKTKTEFNKKVEEAKEELSKTTIKQSKTKQTLKLQQQQLQPKAEVVKTSTKTRQEEKDQEHEAKMLAPKTVAAGVLVQRKQEEGEKNKCKAISKLVEETDKEKKKEKEKDKEKETFYNYKVKVLEMPAPNVWKSYDLKKETDFKSTTIADFPSLSLPQSRCKTNQQEQQQQQQEKLPKSGMCESNFDDFLLSALRPLDVSLPPLPALEPLRVLPEVVGATTTTMATDSLINFESPLQENALGMGMGMGMPRKITPPPRGFTEHNLILALCGSLHYENEYGQLMGEREKELEIERETAAVVELLKSTPTTSASNTSNNSSGSEEESTKKLSKKQHKRAKQQQQQQDEDEELRPLISISMCDSQLKQTTDNDDDVVDVSIVVAAVADDDNDNDNDIDNDDDIQTLPENLLHFVGGTVTTDSDDAVPATTTTTTTSDNTNNTLPTTPQQQQQSHNKLKTKKLEHKINLIAAIEAATSSSSSSATSSSSCTSSAEESSVETTTTTSNNNVKATTTVAAAAAVVTVAATGTATTTATAAATSTTATSVGMGVTTATATSVGQPSATKKKTKRRKR